MVGDYGALTLLISDSTTESRCDKSSKLSRLDAICCSSLLFESSIFARRFANSFAIDVCNSLNASWKPAIDALTSARADAISPIAALFSAIATLFPAMASTATSTLPVRTSILPPRPSILPSRPSILPPRPSILAARPSILPPSMKLWPTDDPKTATKSATMVQQLRLGHRLLLLSAGSWKFTKAEPEMATTGPRDSSCGAASKMPLYQQFRQGYSIPGSARMEEPTRD